REVEAITLQSGGGDGSTEALTENYLKAKVEGDIEANRWIRLQVKGIDGDRLAGVVSPVVASPMNARREEILAF
ncbi:MAG: hypothetical protein WB817_01750, partial [Terriglobales bacterium]